MTERNSDQLLVYNDTYQKIIIAAQVVAAELKQDLPQLPSQEELQPFEGLMYAQDKSLIAAVRRHQEAWGEPAYAHGFEHLEWVAVNGAYVASQECSEKGITGELRNEIIRSTWRLGLMHDLQRWRGYGKEHMIESSKAARQILGEFGINDTHISDQVRVHDDALIIPRGNPRFDIPIFSVFAADHLNWGLELEKTRWEALNRKNADPAKAIHDYRFLEEVQQSPNFQQTKWGGQVALPYVGFGIAIASRIETQFQQVQTESA